MDLNGITVVTGENCPACTKLINMMNKLGVTYRVKTQQELARLKILNIPTILVDGVRVCKGCPGSLRELKLILKFNK